MSTVSGVVEAVSTKFDKYSVLIDGTWYATKMEYAHTKPVKGDSIEFDNGGEGKKFLSKVKITGSGGSVAASGATSSGTATKSYSRGAFPIDPLDGTRSIIRQNSLTNAVNFSKEAAAPAGTEDWTVDDVLNLAREFEAYSAGDLDRIAFEEAKAKLEAGD